MFDFTAEDASKYLDTYIIPFAINLALAIVIYVVGKFVVKIIVNIVGKLLKKAKYDDMLVDFLKAIANAVLMLFVIIAALNELGIDTSSLVAILAAAGLAIGLSLQGSLSNFAAGVMLLVFRPFKAGDFVDAGGATGVVKNISIFTTTMNSVDNKLIIVPNGSIYSGNITNFSAMDTRRVDMVFGIGYDDDLKKAKEILTEMINADDRVLKDPAPQVALSELGDSSVNFVVRPWVNSADFWGLKFDFTEAVKLRFDAEGISIPYPQMDVHVHKQGE
ncbi:mechanosensitive ion channel family protein [Agaribacter marinus]|uniref:Small-conductance mechanosensitive channel n=1 Tax=Agaribacter marinus TaxID=1431249 RepID=A0AA37WHH3_9ALTE|nr:mechanosensitive ion channel domain-containing protein [Agaribacter marinus]GLR71101.1 mechanosensitive ion channel protein [Agaribacter marinus]